MNAALLCKLKFIYVFVIASVRLLFWDLIILRASIVKRRLIWLVQEKYL